jgi:hypothetical protein
LPEGVVSGEALVRDFLGKFGGVALHKLELAILCRGEVLMILVSIFDHLVTDLNADQNLIVIENLREELCRTHAGFNDGNLFVRFFQLSVDLLEQSNLVAEQLEHAGSCLLLNVNDIPPDAGVAVFPDLLER